MAFNGTTKYSKENFSVSAVTGENGDKEDEEETEENLEIGKNSDKFSILVNVFALNLQPFSSVHRKLLPKYYDEAEELFDEFGFRKQETDESDDPTKETPLIETSSHRMKWLSLIEFTHEHVLDELIWGNVQIERIRNSPKFYELLNCSGIPHSLRPFLWPRLSGATAKRLKSSCQYAEILRQCAKDSTQQTVVPQIEKDLLRTLPTNYCFSRFERKGTQALRRILSAVAFMYPDLGYCQGMGIVVASLLLVCSEEDSFWIMSSLVENLLPPNYYSHSLLGVRADERIVHHLMQVHMPELMELIKKSELNMSMITINWLITLLSSVLPIRTLLRVWDLLFTSGSVMVFRVIISMLKMNDEKIIESAQSLGNFLMSDIFALIQQIPTQFLNIELLFEVVQSFQYSITDHLIEEMRKKHQGILMADSNIIYENNGITNLPKQKVNRRKLSTNSKSIMQQFFHQTDENGYDNNDDPKTKNIRQTELVVDLRNAISQICQHFAKCSGEKHEKPVLLQADYTAEKDAMDREHFFKARREGRKRARALLDFLRQDEDELGFRKNQLITIVSEKDEHCWVGELDGKRGWFPAKFVEIIDERGKNYCVQGDEMVEFRIVELTRGLLAIAFRRILFHGIKRSSRISTFVSHPWPFIEVLSSSLVECQHSSSNSRLTLCDTFKLDQDGKILSPEELLFRSVQSINVSHNFVNAQLDTKFRSLIALALNEQCLHLWFDIFCNSIGKDAIRRRYYHSWSFIRSPVAHQTLDNYLYYKLEEYLNSLKMIKSELRLLSQFAFNLNVESELGLDASSSKNANFSFFGSKFKIGMRSKTQSNLQSAASLTSTSKKISESNSTIEKQPLKEGVKDMLIKHHLFSWDL